MRVGGEIGVTIRGDNRPYKQVLEDSKRDTKKFEESVEKSTAAAEKAFYDLGHKIGESMRTGISRAGNYLTLGVTLPIIAATRSAINAASDLEESSSKVAVTFGTARKRIEEFGKSSAEAFGISKRAAFDFSSTFGGILRETKLSEDALAQMSVQLTKLGGDLASFKNIKPEEALEKLRAGLTGEYEPLKNIGYVLNEAAVAAKAAEMGFKGKTKELSESQKMLARYAIILDKTKDAQNDFKRTQDGVANQSRITRAEVEELAAEFGKELLPITKDAIKMGRELIRAFKDLEPAQRQQILKWVAIAAAAGPALKIISGLLAVTKSIIGIRDAYVTAQAAMAAADIARGRAAGGAAISIAGMGGSGFKPVGIAGGALALGAGVFAVSNELASRAVDAGNARYQESLKNNPPRFNQGTRPTFAGSHPENSAFGGLFKESKNLADTFREIANKGKVAVGPAKKDVVADLKGEINAKMAGGGLVGPINGKKIRAGGGGGGGSSIARENGPGWMEEMLAEIMEDVWDVVRDRVESVQDYFKNLKRQQFDHGGQRNRVDSFLFDKKNDPDSAAAKMGPLDLIKALGGLSGMDKADAQAERDAQLKDRQKQIDAIREQARETGVLAGMENTLLNLEQKKGSAFFSFYRANAESQAKTLVIQKEQTQAAQDYVRNLREELGLEKQLTEIQKLQQAVAAGGRMEHASPGEKFKAMWYAMGADAKKRGPFEQGTVIDTGAIAGTERYRDTIRDLAIEMGGLGDLTGYASERLRLLSSGMSETQAQHVIDTQRRIREMQELTNIVRGGADSMAQVMLDSFRAMGGGADDFFRTLIGGFRQTLADMAAEYLKSYFRRLMFDLVGNIFGGKGGVNLNGASDGGGQSMVTASGAARGPAAAPSIVVNMPIHTPDVGGFRRSQSQVMSDAVAIALTELKRTG